MEKEHQLKLKKTELKHRSRLYLYPIEQLVEVIGQSFYDDFLRKNNALFLEIIENAYTQDRKSFDEHYGIFCSKEHEMIQSLMETNLAVFMYVHLQIEAFYKKLIIEKEDIWLTRSEYEEFKASVKRASDFDYEGMSFSEEFLVLVH